MKSTHVHYEITFRPSQAAYARFGEALFMCDAQVLSTSTVLHGTAIAIVAVAPKRAAEFASRVGTTDGNAHTRLATRAGVPREDG